MDEEMLNEQLLLMEEENRWYTLLLAYLRLH